jgi:hypothetical protein
VEEDRLMGGDDLTRGDRPVKSLQENYIEMVRAQQFDGTVICKLQRELGHLRRENERLMSISRWWELTVEYLLNRWIR